uniref:Uncharacterized protein n=1 Tax=Candidatus Kentrum sp. DK TaxID=2126562 RepID=A0A450TSA7_9GAMM|nr:MAG: hypothetical protein BECKDK2373B_GA0170837_13141 [Candidatus Kentron sp. DK]
MTERSERIIDNGQADDLTAISEIAQRRRADLEEDLSKPIPDFVIQTDQAEVMYTIEPVMLPFSQMDFQAFANRLRDRYGVKYKRPQVPRSLLALGNMGDEDDETKLSAVPDLLAADMPSERLEFVEGRILIGNDDAIPVKSITMNQESVYVIVRGDSKVAEVIAKEVVEELWASTGIPRRWDRIEPMLQMVSYGTATKINFGIPLEDFFSSPFREFIESDCLAGKNFCARSVSRSARDGFLPPPQDHGDRAHFLVGGGEHIREE